MRSPARPELLVLVAACASTPEPAVEPEPSAPAPRRSGISDERLCEAYCDRAVACGIDASICANECPGKGRDVSGMRRDYVMNLMLCLDGASCSGIKSQQAWSGCHEAVVSTLKPTTKLRRFCFLSSRRAAQCKRGDDADQSACLVRFRYQDDAALEAGIRCLEEPCGSVPGCMAGYLVP